MRKQLCGIMGLRSWLDAVELVNSCSYSCLSGYLPLNLVGKTTALIYKMRANAQMGVRSESLRPIRQLFVTRSKVLTQHIASNYRGLVESSEIAFKTAEELEEMRKANKYQNRELVEFDNEVDLRDDLPRRFSQLTDANFPLFVSFDKVSGCYCLN